MKTRPVLFGSLGAILALMAVVIYRIEFSSITSVTKSLVVDQPADVFLLVTLPSIIGVIASIIASEGRRVAGFLMIASGLIVMYPNLLIVSNAMTIFSGLMYVVGGVSLLIKKNKVLLDIE